MKPPFPFRGVATVGAVFAGVGGIERGLAAAGPFRVAWTCENDPDAVAVLRAVHPDAPNYPDVRKLVDADPPRVSVLTAGFPCQDVSNIGRRAGVRHGKRSSLVFDFFAAVRVLRPCVFVMENVEALLARGRGFDAVLGSISACGYDAEWDVVPASAVGAPQLRERVFVVAWRRDLETRLRGADDVPGPVRVGRDGRSGEPQEFADRRHARRPQGRGVAAPTGPRGVEGTGGMAVRPGGGRDQERDPRHEADQGRRPGALGGRGLPPLRVFDRAILRECAARNLDRGGAWPLLSESGMGRTTTRFLGGAYLADAWEDGVPRVLAGVPRRGPRLKAIGNSVVPQVAEYVGRCVLQAFPALPWVNPWVNP